MSERVFIIAEAGVNHNGDLLLAQKLVEEAARAGADAVKFQSFKASELVTPTAEKADYQKETSGTTESQFTMLRKLELDADAHDALIAHCQKNNILFLSTPFDADSLDMLLEIGISVIKIPSGEITNLPYLRHVGTKKKPVILSTGMATIEEIEAAVHVLVSEGIPPEKITLLHCNTQYPTPFEDANLKAMDTLGSIFPQCAIGYSDHTAGIACPIAATAMGAVVIEKHFTLDKTMEGPDHAASIDPEELAAMVAGIRNIELALGNGAKQPSQSERSNIKIARRFLVAITAIPAGAPFTATNIAARRTGNGGISPMHWDEVMNQTAKRDFAVGEAIEL